MALHRQGKLAEAEHLYQEVLRQDPGHADALHLSGVIALQAGRVDRGLELIRRAIRLNPNNAAAHNNIGFALQALKRLPEALASYDRAIALNPSYAEAYNNRGNTLAELGRLPMALASYDKAIVLNPGYAEAYKRSGDVLAALGRLAEALASYDRALALKPDDADAAYGRGNALQMLQRLDAALASYDRAIALRPDHADAYNNRGVAFQGLNRLDAALASHDRAIALKPDYADAYNNRGVALQRLKRLDEALKSYDRVIELKPDFAGAHNNRGNTLAELGRLPMALASYDKAIALAPDYALAHNNRGNALKDLKRLDEALTSFDRATALNPNYAEAYSNRGNALRELKRLDEALACHERAIALMPQFAEAYNNRGTVLAALKRLPEALASYDKAIALAPDYAEAYNNRGSALAELKLLDEAVASHDRAISLNPRFAEAYNNRAIALSELKRFDEALASYQQAAALKPDYEFLAGSLLYTKMQLCDWRGLESDASALTRTIEDGGKASLPFPMCAISSSPRALRTVAETWTTAKFPRSDALPHIDKRARRDRIRIGYFSADFHQHPTSVLMAGLFEHHDRSGFEIISFSYGPDTADAIRQRIQASSDKFVDVRSRSDREVAELARELEIDIAVDLKGYTQDARTGIFAMRAAPIQVNYLGYPGTMGADYIDYLIADATLIPQSQQANYVEKILYLPNSYQVNDSKRVIGDKIPARADMGLPQTAFVFCCFNNNYKITPDVFDGWMRILKGVGGSVLWLLQGNAAVGTNLRNEAASRGVDPERLVFAERMPLPDHLARHRLADLFLDTLPYTAHTTASDALWAGLPVLTRIGETFAGRVAASLLNAIGLPELIASTPEAYEALAIDLATHPGKLADIRRKLDANRLMTPLFDTELFARHIEAGYVAMYERYHAGRVPDHIYIPA